MRAEIISVGTELLLGDIVNTNAQYLAQELAALGFAVYHQSVVGDNPARLRAVTLEAKERSDLLIFTGGLGPTADDLTKETVAETFGDTLVLDPEELAKLEEYSRRQGKVMAPNNRKQAMVPRRGHKLDNPNGSAPGAFFRQGGKMAVLLPGPPREMKPMFDNEVRPLLEEMQDGTIRSRTLRVVGIGESDLEMKLQDLLGGSNPTAALYAKEGEVHVRVTAKAATAEQADYMCGEMALLIEQIAGDTVYSEDDSDLPATVVRLLVEQGKTVALAESCTGGMLAQRITSAPGASLAFGYGAVSYANEFKRRMLGVRRGTLLRHGAVSSQVCAEMAFGAAKKGMAEYGVGITGIAGPGGGTEAKPVGLIYIGVASGRRVFIRKLNVQGRDREYVRTIATQNALDMLRRVVLGLAVPGAKEFGSSQHADFERLGRPRKKGGVLLRALVAILLVGVLFTLLVLGAYYLQRGGAGLKGAYPTVRGLQYGTREYEQAVQRLIQQEKEENPAVTGFLALPGGLVEEFVAQSQTEQAALAGALNQPGLEGMAVLQAGAALSERRANTLVAGGGALRPMLELADPAQAAAVSTFTYYTENDAREYRVFAAAYLDDDQPQPDGFDPALKKLTNYNDYLTFLLGAQGRSLYAIPLRVEEGDSFMTLQTETPDVPGRRFFLFGRLARPGETAPLGLAAPAGLPLMPEAYYKQEGLPQPDFEEYYGRWMRRYLSGEVDNMDLQLQAGMPEEDVAPTITVYPETPEEEAVTAEEPDDVAPQAETPAGTNPEGGAQEPVPVSEAIRQASREEIRLVSAQKSPLPASSAVQVASPSAGSAGGSGTGAPQSSSAVSSTTEEQTSGTENAPASSLPASSAAPQVTAPPPAPTILRPDPRFLMVRMNGVLVRDTTANVLAAICQSEMPGAPPEAVKAQAVAVHSWILNQQGAGNLAPSVRGEAASTEMRATVEEVDMLVLSADGYNPAFTPWFGMAAEGTNASADIWGISRAYLRGVPAAEEAGFEGWKQSVAVPRQELENLLREQLGLSPETMGEPHTWLQEVRRNESGYVVSLQVGEKTLSGLAFWQDFLVRGGGTILPSPAFEVEYSGEEFHFTVYGHGHGAGLSQAGAVRHAAKDLLDYKQILAYYFPETTPMEWV